MQACISFCSGEPPLLEQWIQHIQYRRRNHGLGSRRYSANNWRQSPLDIHRLIQSLSQSIQFQEKPSLDQDLQRDQCTYFNLPPAHGCCCSCLCPSRLWRRSISSLKNSRIISPRTPRDSQRSWRRASSNTLRCGFFSWIYIFLFLNLVKIGSFESVLCVVIPRRRYFNVFGSWNCWRIGCLLCWVM